MVVLHDNLQTLVKQKRYIQILTSKAYGYACNFVLLYTPYAVCLLAQFCEYHNAAINMILVCIGTGTDKYSSTM